MTLKDIIRAHELFANGENIMAALRKENNSSHNNLQIIEVAYDLQAGTYIKNFFENKQFNIEYTRELADILNPFIEQDSRLLDVGSGELTTIASVLKHFVSKPRKIYCFDISWSRIFCGQNFARDFLGRKDFGKLVPFVASMNHIPLPDKSIDLTTSSHALEPNAQDLIQIMSELFRVTKKHIVLFEPCYEIASPRGKLRMDRHGYIKDIEGVVTKLGGRLLERIPLNNVENQLNPTACFIIEPNLKHSNYKYTSKSKVDLFSIPGSSLALKKSAGFYNSPETGLCFPILSSIPILTLEKSILASAKFK